MTAIMNNTSSYLDFLDIAIDAFNEGKIEIYTKLMTTIISSYKSLLHNLEIQNSGLEDVEELVIKQEELELFYDDMYDLLDYIKLLKKRIDSYKEKDKLFLELYNLFVKLHEAILLHIDIISTQEVKDLQKKLIKVS